MRWRDVLGLSVLAVAAGVCGPDLSFAQRGPGGVTAGAGRSSGSGQAGEVYRAVAAMVEAGQFDRADALLRARLIEAPDDDIAAEALRDLYRLPGVRPSVDEIEIGKALQSLGPGFRRYESDRFIALSNCDPDWTRARMDLLERTYHQFERVLKRMGLECVPPRHRMLCILFDDHAAYAAFAREHDGVEAGWVAGYYASRTNRVVFYNDATGPAFRNAAQQIEQYREMAQTAERRAVSARSAEERESAAALREQAKRFKAHLNAEQSRLQDQVEAASITKTIHEATHLIAFNCGLQSRAHQYPFWLTEGLASSFETLDARKAFGPDASMEGREREFAEVVRQGKLAPLDVLVQLNSLTDADAETARAMYAQAQALFRYLYRYERDRLAAYLRDIQREPPGPISPARHAEMFEARFGSPQRVERQWLREVERTTLAAAE